MVVVGVTAVGVTDVSVTAVILGVIALFVSVTLLDTMGVVTSSGVTLLEVPTVVGIAPVLEVLSMLRTR